MHPEIATDFGGWEDVLKLIMNELHKEEAGGSPTVQNTAKLFEPNGPRRYELPETWAHGYVFDDGANLTIRSKIEGIRYSR